MNSRHGTTYVGSLLTGNVPRVQWEFDGVSLSHFFVQSYFTFFYQIRIESKYQNAFLIDFRHTLK